ncbi:MAG: hypothetical protein H7X71_02550 [Chitinophagales bacterium]|nr:hypothetical protein [Chitinophagales bacterium]
MKHVYFRLMVTMLLLLIFSFSYSQIVGTSGFLKTQRIELGVNGNGTYITEEVPPEGYHFGDALYAGMVADADKDGWAEGDPAYCGDYFAPGSPVEGFVMQVGSDIYTNDFTITEIPGFLNKYISDVSNLSITWHGYINDHQIDVRQRTDIKPGRTSAFTHITLFNRSDETINDIYYTRNCDPDQDVLWSGDFSTNNIVIENFPADDRAIVTAEGTTYGCFLGMGSLQSYARVSYGGFSTDGITPAEAWNGISPHINSGSATSDEAITISFYVPTLASGESVVLIFAYGTLDRELDEDLRLTTDEIAEQIAA